MKGILYVKMEYKREEQDAKMCIILILIRLIVFEEKLFNKIK